MSEQSTEGRTLAADFDPRKTGWSVEDCIEVVEELGDDPERQYYYTTYSDVYHTSPACPHIQDSENLHVTGMLSSLNGPYRAGAHRIVSPMDDGEDLDECSWCATHSIGAENDE